MRFLTFSKIEIKEILKAWFAVSLVFAIAFVGIGPELLLAIPIALVTGGIGFLLHELAHKYLAQKYRCWAEFRANNQALILGLALSFFHIIILAPGGVFIRGATAKQHGKIAFAGPAMNILIAMAFYAASFLTNPWLSITADYGFKINSFLAVFNLIPFRPFDGGAVWQWNKFIWIIGVIISIVLMSISLALIPAL